MTTLQRCLLLSGGLLFLLGCAVAPQQPSISEPFALLSLSASTRLLAIDAQTIDSRFALDTLRVDPGPHVLRFRHVNAGPDGSAAHEGQDAAPFGLNAHEGMTYAFEAKT